MSTTSFGEYVKGPLAERLGRGMREEPVFFWSVTAMFVLGGAAALYSGYYILFGDFLL